VASPFLCILLLLLLLLEVVWLWGIVLVIKVYLALKLVLVFEFVGLEIFLTFQTSTITSLKPSSACVFCSRLFHHMKTPNEIRNRFFYLLYFREVEKFLHEGGSLAMVPPTMNLSNKTHLNYLASLATDCVFWAFLTMKRSSVIL
jgi:hypothetical protein